ncbi:MAG: aminotransferase class III-fold pyridoxal phosphate-dependent enzyme [Candidatus Dormibacteraeota bacterium]|jgi:4-aminobutyrate aminotransferase|nr:aminotransferase class III-fold pyridoxal phosphate-dependent enzyme [Candidatus Dormibacteraeota bacterium]
MVKISDRHRAAIMAVQPMETELEIERGEGSHLFAADGRTYLDLATGIAVNAVGYGHPQVVRAIEEQLHRHLHLYSGTGYQSALVAYAEALLEELPQGFRLFFGNSGTEAVEAAIKMARFVTGRPGIIAFRGAFHGRTMGSLSLTASAARYRAQYEPLLPSVYHLDYPAPTRLDLAPDEALEHVQRQMSALLETEITPERVALVFVEPIQGEGGYVIPPDAFLPWLRDLTAQHGILLAVDEVQSGMGRTGKMFAYQHSGIEPDLVVMGKALGGGLPLSALAAPAALAERWPEGAHGTTFGGNPLSCAAGLATLQVIREENLMAAAARLGTFAVERLAPLGDLEEIREVRGRGLMVAIEFRGPRAGDLAQRVMATAVARGMILHTAGLRHEVIRLMPPLNIEEQILADGLDRLVAIVREVCAGGA